MSKYSVLKCNRCGSFSDPGPTLPTWRTFHAALEGNGLFSKHSILYEHLCPRCSEQVDSFLFKIEDVP
jgi:DNA-directed RNA polymerase subunit RPC12/RpoP